MSDKNTKKKKGVKTMRKPPSETDLDAWVQGADKKGSSPPKSDGSKASVKSSGSQVAKSSSSQVTDNLDEDNAPTGPGIVERTDGYRRRLVVYLDPEHAKQLKVHSVLNDESMSDIVDELVGKWLSSKTS